jgi:uncharacterized protein (DUF1778 family)
MMGEHEIWVKVNMYDALKVGAERRGAAAGRILEAACEAAEDALTHHPLTRLDDLPTDELEALYELTGVQRRDASSPELLRARKWLSDACYERQHGPIKRYQGDHPIDELRILIDPDAEP